MPQAQRFRPPVTVAKAQAKTAAQQATRVVDAQKEKTLSLAVVRTLLEVSLGAIAFIRNLLPDENFEDRTFSAVWDRTQELDEGESQNQSQSQSGSQNRPWKLRTIKRNISEQGDKMLDLLSSGVMDALDKGYLKRLVVFIFLDPDKCATRRVPPLTYSIIESYTYDFFYSAGSQLPSIAVTATNAAAPPAQASISPITVGEMKKAIRTLTKRLLVSLANFEDLPDMKLLYYDSAPDSYHPSGFAAGPAQPLLMGTHSPEERPDLLKIGQLITPNFATASIAHHLPQQAPGEDQASLDSYSANQRGGARKRRYDDMQEQAFDAAQRDIVWDAELNAGALHPDPMLGIAYASHARNAVGDEDEVQLLGQRTPSGTIVPVPPSMLAIAANSQLVDGFHERDDSLDDASLIEATQGDPNWAPAGRGAPHGASIPSALPVLDTLAHDDSADAASLDGIKSLSQAMLSSLGISGSPKGDLPSLSPLTADSSLTTTGRKPNKTSRTKADATPASNAKRAKKAKGRARAPAQPTKATTAATARACKSSRANAFLDLGQIVEQA